MAKKLPVVGTSAATTTFCATRVDGPGGLHLWVDGNGKITRDRGDLEHPVPNAFSLLSQGVENKAGRGGTHCPGATKTCIASCYVDGLAKHAADTYALYKHNSETLREILFGGVRNEADAWAMTFAEWIAANCSTFRWHVSGDVFSPEYALWIRDVCREASDVQFWIYTRSFAPEILEPLASVATFNGGNLALNLSCDRDNWRHAELARERASGGVWKQCDGCPDMEHPEDLHAHPVDGPRLCYLTNDGLVPQTLPEGSVIFPDYALRGGTEEGRAWFAALESHHKKMVCPVDYGGKSEERRCGPCARCLS